MKSLGLAFFSDINWTLLALILFFSSFFIILLMNVGAFSKEKANRVSQLPFEGDFDESN